MPSRHTHVMVALPLTSCIDVGCAVASACRPAPPPRGFDELSEIHASATSHSSYIDVDPGTAGWGQQAGDVHPGQLCLRISSGCTPRCIMQHPLSNGNAIGGGTCVRVTHTDRCAHGMLSVTALVDPCSIHRAHSALPLLARCHCLQRHAGT